MDYLRSDDDAEALRRRVRLLERTQSAAGIGGWELEVPTADLRWTDETYRIHGLSRQEYTLTVGNAIDCYAPASKAQYYSAFCTACATGQPYDLDLEVVTPAGEHRWVRTLGYCDPPTGVPQRLYGTFQDITDIRTLERTVLETTQNERERLSYALHDGIGQDLTGTALLLRSLADHAREANPTLALDLDYATRLVNRTLETCRTLADEVAPASPARGGLEGALRKLAARTQRTFDVLVSSSIQVSPEADLNSVTSDQFYWIAQQAVTNSADSGGASTIQIDLTATAVHVMLSISDNGLRAASVNLQASMAVRTMRHRARLIGARFDLRLAATGGAVIRCILE